MTTSNLCPLECPYREWEPVRQCAWCLAVEGPSGFQPGPDVFLRCATHGICPACHARQLVRMVHAPFARSGCPFDMAA